MIKGKAIYSVLLLIISFSLFSQEKEVLKQNDSVVSNKTKKNLKQFIIPSALIVYGVVGLESHQLLDFNTEIREELREHIDEKLTVDDFSQYSPLVSIYALEGLGIKGKNLFQLLQLILFTGS